MIDHNTSFVALCAVRYALGRMSYAPSIVMDWCAAAYVIWRQR